MPSTPAFIYERRAASTLLSRIYLSSLNRRPKSACSQSAVAEFRTTCSPAIFEMRSHFVPSCEVYHRQSSSTYRGDTVPRTARRSQASGAGDCDETSDRRRYGRMLTCMIVADPSRVPSPIQLATSSMFGTVADTTTKRMDDPRSFIRERITSRVLPRDSLRICTCGGAQRFVR